MSTYSLKEVVYVDSIPLGKKCLLAADIGGTNSNFGFFIIHNNSFTLLFSLHAKSQEIDSFIKLVQQIITYAHQRYRIAVINARFAAAGVVSQYHDYCKPTNLNFAIDLKNILSNTTLDCAVILNDFEIIGYGIGVINPKSLIHVSNGYPEHYANRAILGAGTG
jgi:glucokinase